MREDCPWGWPGVNPAVTLVSHVDRLSSLTPWWSVRRGRGFMAWRVWAIVLVLAWASGAGAADPRQAAHQQPQAQRKSAAEHATVEGDQARAGSAAVMGKERITWPGMTREGTVLLPNGWSLKPAGRQTKLGDFPVQIALHPSRPILAILHAGYGEHEVVTVDGSTGRCSAGSRCRGRSLGWSGRPMASSSSPAAGSTT